MTITVEKDKFSRWNTIVHESQISSLLFSTTEVGRSLKFRFDRIKTKGKNENANQQLF